MLSPSNGFLAGGDVAVIDSGSNFRRRQGRLLASDVGHDHRGIVLLFSVASSAPHRSLRRDERRCRVDININFYVGRYLLTWVRVVVEASAVRTVVDARQFGA